MVVEESPVEQLSKSTERNRRKKEARKKAAERKANESATQEDTSEVTETLGQLTLGQANTPHKRLKNLRKKLAQIDALKLKIENGELANPDPDQIRKIERRDEVMHEIGLLEQQL